MQYTVVPVLSETDVLTRARAILAGGPLMGTYAECGLYCPWCGIAVAKSALDKEYGTGGDLPLILARMALYAYRDIDTVMLSQEGALEMFDHVLAM